MDASAVPKPPADLSLEELVAFYCKQFKERFKTDDDCFAEWYRIAHSEGLIKCRKCGESNFGPYGGGRTVECINCETEIWITSGTFFDHIRAVRAWMAAIWLTQQGLFINSMQLSKHFNIVSSTAQLILKKTRAVILNCMGEDTPRVSSGLFSPIFGKRSRETPAREHPVAEVEEISQRMDSNSTSTSLDGDTTPDNKLSGQEKDVYECLSETPVDIEQLIEQTGIPLPALLATLTMLELMELVKRLDGNRYIQCAKPPPAAKLITESSNCISNNLIEDCLDCIRLIFQGTSRKCWQFYLAGYWCYRDRTTWCEKSLLLLCIQHGPLSDRQVLEYVSPALVKMLPTKWEF